MAQEKPGMDRYAIFLCNKGIMQMISNEFFLFKRVWITGMMITAVDRLCPGYGSGPYILSWSHIEILKSVLWIPTPILFILVMWARDRFVKHAITHINCGIWWAVATVLLSCSMYAIHNMEGGTDKPRAFIADIASTKNITVRTSMPLPENRTHRYPKCRVRHIYLHLGHVWGKCR